MRSSLSFTYDPWSFHAMPLLVGFMKKVNFCNFFMFGFLKNKLFNNDMSERLLKIALNPIHSHTLMINQCEQPIVTMIDFIIPNNSQHFTDARILSSTYVVLNLSHVNVKSSLLSKLILNNCSGAQNHWALWSTRQNVESL